VNGTSRLSPHLHFGEIGPRQIWHAVLMTQAASGVQTHGGALLRQLIWREFSYHLLYHFPNLPERICRT
jgi:deoxyribodipyrimidine photo-lyase